MQLNDKAVLNIAKLAHLTINEGKASDYATNLSNILGFVEQMNTVDTSNIDPMGHPLDQIQRLRSDSVTETDQRDHFQSRSPDVENGLFLVPKVIE